MGYSGIGVRRQHAGKTLDVWYFWIGQSSQLPADLGSALSDADLKNLADDLRFSAAERKLFAHARHLSDSLAVYSEKDVVLFREPDLSAPISEVEDAYFRLHLISRRLFKPHQIGLDHLFSVLPNLAWTSAGPVFPDDLDWVRMDLMAKGQTLAVTHVDKFPYLVNYFVPSGVRIASGAQVRLGAYLGEGTTVMAAGYVNFNAGTLGKAMIEGRVSAGVVVGDDTDVGGGASILGTLSGGNKTVLSVGEKCLLGANAGVGISLGDGCTVEAGLYVTAGTKVSLYDANGVPIGLLGDATEEGQNVVKASALSGRSHLLFYRDSISGKVVAKPNLKMIELNAALHVNA